MSVDSSKEGWFKMKVVKGLSGCCVGDCGFGGAIGGGSLPFGGGGGGGGFLIVGLVTMSFAFSV